MKEALLDSALAEMREGMELPKCLKCGCMRDALELLSESLPSLDLADRDAVVAELDAWLSELEEQKYSCAGCSHCFGAVAANILHDITDEATTAASGAVAPTVDQDIVCSPSCGEPPWASEPSTMTPCAGRSSARTKIVEPASAINAPGSRRSMRAPTTTTANPATPMPCSTPTRATVTSVRIASPNSNRS